MLLAAGSVQSTRKTNVEQRAAESCRDEVLPVRLQATDRMWNARPCVCGVATQTTGRSHHRKRRKHAWLVVLQCGQCQSNEALAKVAAHIIHRF